jgi:hypothetical protein
MIKYRGNNTRQRHTSSVKLISTTHHGVAWQAVFEKITDSRANVNGVRRGDHPHPVEIETEGLHSASKRLDDGLGKSLPFDTDPNSH